VFGTSPRAQGDQAASTTRRYATDSNFDVEVVLSSKVTERFHQLGRLREVGLEWEGVSSATRASDNAESRAQATDALQELGGRLSRASSFPSSRIYDRAAALSSSSCMADALSHFLFNRAGLEVLNLSFSLLPSLHEAAHIANVLPKLVHLSLK